MTIDWVTEATGNEGPSECERHGHRWQEIGERREHRVHYGQRRCLLVRRRCLLCGIEGDHAVPGSEEPS